MVVDAPGEARCPSSTTSWHSPLSSSWLLSPSMTSVAPAAVATTSPIAPALDVSSGWLRRSTVEGRATLSRHPALSERAQRSWYGGVLPHSSRQPPEDPQLSRRDSRRRKKVQLGTR